MNKSFLVLFFKKEHACFLGEPTLLPTLTPSEDSLEPVETWPTDRLRALQFQRLRWSLRHAWEHVPHTRHALEDAKLHPDDLETLADLPRFPFTTRRDLRAHPPLGLLAVPPSRLVRLHATAGTTGRPILAGHTAKDQDTAAALMARSLRAAGVQPGRPLLVLLPDGLAPWAAGAIAGAEKHGSPAMPAANLPAAELVPLLQALEPQAAIATPEALQALLAAWRRAGLAAEDCPLQVAIQAGAPPIALDPGFPLHHLGHYGMAELMGPGLAQSCVEAPDGLTLWEDHFFPEIVDPAGRPLPDGEPGELVLTTLTREAMPLIRYRTGDQARLLPGTTRTLRRLVELRRL